MGLLNAGEDQAAKNLSAIEELARESSLPVEEVKEVYENELARLRDGARITDFLILFASRRTRDTLAHRAR